MNKVIVTGATGFIGSWLVEYLLSKNIYVCAIVRNKTKLAKRIVSDARFTFIECPLEKIDKIRIDGYWDAFYHLAWAGVQNELKNDLGVQLSNIDITVKMLELSNLLGCKRFIATGTVAEYVFNNGVMDFSRKQSPNDYYGAAKVAVHYFLNVRALQLGIEYIWAVIPSTFGERREGNNILTYTISTLLKGEKPVYGKLTQMWDFLYVYEVARALFLIGDKGIDGKIYGIGSGIHRPLRCYVEEIRNMINPDLPLGIGELEDKSPQLMSSCVDIADLKKDTGFIPEISFNEGIKRTIKYMKDIQN